MTNLEIIYQDEHFVAVNKPPGLLVHRTPIARDASEFALQKLRNQLNQHVFPAHRLDRKTSGVLLFSLNAEADRMIKDQFARGEIRKTYLAVVRGYAPEQMVIDYDLKDERGRPQSAITHWKTLEQYELPIPFGQHLTSRYSLVELSPNTGRFHQLRRHAAHIFHPIIGDRPHGCNKQNKLWKEKWDMTEMLLHASRLTFYHPYQNKEITIEASQPLKLKRVISALRSADTTLLDQIKVV